MSKAFEAQFQRSGPASPRPERESAPVDAASALKRFTEGGEKADTMSGKEMYAIVDMLKREHGAEAAALEASLLKVKRQLDKKIMLLDWVGEHVSPAAAVEKPRRASLADCTNTAPPAAEAAAPLATAADAIKRQQASRSSATQEAAPAAAKPPAEDGRIARMAALFVEGKDALSMTGGEMFEVIGWLKRLGHAEVEDSLIRVRLQGDKKTQLVSYLKRNWATLPTAAAEPAAAAAAEPAARRPKPSAPIQCPRQPKQAWHGGGLAVDGRRGLDLPHLDHHRNPPPRRPHLLLPLLSAGRFLCRRRDSEQEQQGRQQGRQRGRRRPDVSQSATSQSSPCASCDAEGAAACRVRAQLPVRGALQGWRHDERPAEPRLRRRAAARGRGPQPRFLDGVGKGVDAHARSESGHASRRRRFRALRDRAHLTDNAQSDRLMTVRRRHGLWL